MFVEDAGHLRARRSRRRATSDPATLHAVGLAGDEVAGAVRLYPLDGDGLWKGDRLAVLPAERALQLGAMLVRFAVRTAGERGGRRMVAQVQVPNVRFFERLGWQLRRRPGADARRHAPADGDRAAAQPPPRPVSGAMSRSQTVAGAVGAGAAVEPRESSKCTADLAGQAAAREHVARGVGVLGRGGEQEAEARERAQPALDGDAGGARQPVDVEHRAAAGGLQQLQQRAGGAGHRDVARRVAQARARRPRRARRRRCAGAPARGRAAT